MASNFDRATIFHLECSNAPKAYMTATEFRDFVLEKDPSIIGSEETIHRCYEDISPFQVTDPAAFVDARTCAIQQIHARRSRARVLLKSTRSSAPASRSAPMASMSDRRGGAGDMGSDDGMD